MGFQSGGVDVQQGVTNDSLTALTGRIYEVKKAMLYIECFDDQHHFSPRVSTMLLHMYEESRLFGWWTRND